MKNQEKEGKKKEKRIDKNRERRNEKNPAGVGRQHRRNKLH